MGETLKVKTHPDQLKAGRVGLWDKNPAHPGGEVWVAGEAIVEVGDTTEVRDAITQKRIIEVKESPAAARDVPDSEAPKAGPDSEARAGKR